MTCVRFAIATLLGFGIVDAAAQEPRTNLGVLTCTSAEKPEAQGPAGPLAMKLMCGLKLSGSGSEERYTGILGRKDGAQAPTGKRVLVWAVLGPAKEKFSPGFLAQRFTVAATPQPSAGQVLVGQSNAKISLQSETMDGDGGVTHLELTLATTPA